MEGCTLSVSIAKTAKILGKAKVLGDAEVYGQSILKGDVPSLQGGSRMSLGGGRFHEDTTQVIDEISPLR